MTLARHRARLAAGLVAVVAASSLAACANPEKGEPGKQPTKASASPATTGHTAEQTSGHAADPAHAVAAPGKLVGAQYGDDLLFVSDKTIPDDLLKKITGVEVNKKKGVVAYNQFSYGQFPVENRFFNLAAVDSADFRRFTGNDNARFQDQWDRVAGGEVAVAQKLQKQLPIDAKGFLSVNKQKIHVGAWSPAGVDSVDAIVNEKWGESLGPPKGNALIVNTGPTSPQVVRERIEKAIGTKTLSIIALDIVAQTGIDPEAVSTVVPVGSFGDAVGSYRYRPIGGGRVQPEAAWVQAHIATEQVPVIGSMTCNKAIFPQLKAALREIVAADLAKEIHPGEYAGCYYPRFIAGTTTLSNHSFGLAFDINVPGNQRGTVGQMHRGVVAILKKWGFAWGGDWAYTDPMHFELARIVQPG